MKIELTAATWTLCLCLLVCFVDSGHLDALFVFACVFCA